MRNSTITPMILASAIAACPGSGAGRGGDRNAAGTGTEATLPTRSIDQVLAAHTDSLMALPGVVGTAVGLCDGERCIKVLLAEPNAATRLRIPERIEGYRVSVDVTGPPRAL